MSSRSHLDIDQLSSSYGQDFTPDVEAGLARLHERLGLDAREAPQAKVRSLGPRQWMAAAAGVLVLIFAAFYLLPDSATVIENPGAAPLAVDLPDGTHVILQAGSRLTYDEDYNRTGRDIELTGQGYFQVAKNTQLPFELEADGTTLYVTGTAFNVRVDGEELEVEVSEGSVELRSRGGMVPIGVKQCGLVTAGKLATMMEAPNLNRHAWRTGKLQFDNASLTDVMRVLHNNWDVTVTLTDDCDSPISGSFNSKDPKLILDGVAKLSGGALQTHSDTEFTLSDVCK